MNLRANHDIYETVKVPVTYDIEDIPRNSEYFQTNASLHDGLALIPELMYRYNEWFTLITLGIYVVIALLLSVILHETGILPFNIGSDKGFFHAHWLSLVLFLVYAIPSTILIKYFCDLRYLVFKGDKAILQSKYWGRRVYQAKDLKFHLLKLCQYNHRYQLEVELPDSSLPEDRRLIILETAATRKTMDGILAVLFPMLRGDIVPSKDAVPRKIEPIPQGEPNNLYYRLDHLENHLHVWFLNYKINQFVFWLVHGSREKVMEKERAKGRL
jgi:hypothetical protein